MFGIDEEDGSTSRSKFFFFNPFSDTTYFLQTKKCMLVLLVDIFLVVLVFSVDLFFVVLVFSTTTEQEMCSCWI